MATHAKTDIDIDFPDRDAALMGLGAVPAMQIANGQPIRHVSGIYLQDVPVNPLTELCALDHATAEVHGYFKIDFLANHLYDGLSSNAEVDALLAREPDWDMLEFEHIVSQMAHIHGHFDIVQAIRPRSLEDLAVVLALIRPGRRHLLGQPREVIDAEIWKPGVDGYVFKRSHAIAFAASLAVQLNRVVDAEIAALDDGDDVFVFNEE
jgi:hypothetical protein